MTPGAAPLHVPALWADDCGQFFASIQHRETLGLPFSPSSICSCEQQWLVSLLGVETSIALLGIPAQKGETKRQQHEGVSDGLTACLRFLSGIAEPNASLASLGERLLLIVM